MDEKNHPPPEAETALEQRGGEQDRLFSPSVARNRDVIRDAFRDNMPHTGKILEIASGAGEHAVHIACAFPDLQWTPSDPDPKSRKSIAAWIEHTGAANIASPLAIDVTEDNWTEEIGARLSGLVAINMIHIAPFEACEGLFNGGAKLLSEHGKIFLYGPFSRGGVHISASNEAFDADLKRRNRSWGVRDLEGDVLPAATRHGFGLETAIAMPANNFSVILKRRQAREAT